MFNQKLFDTSVYSAGAHRLKVTYNGNSTTTPLAMAYILIQNSTIAYGSTVSSTSLTSSATAIHPAPSSENLGAPIGGALGGAAILVIVIVLFIFYRRRRRRDSKDGFDTSIAASELNTPFLLTSQADSHTDGQVTPQRGTMPHSKAREAEVTLTFRPSESTHRDPSDSLPLTGSGSPSLKPSRVVVNPDSGTSSSGSRVPAPSPVLDSPPEYTLN